MPSIQLIPTQNLNQQPAPLDVGIDMFFGPSPGSDDAVALAQAVSVALNTDRLALPDDDLPTNDGDRRGWWADLDAQAIRGGWPIGSRIWLLSRSKITDAGAKEGATIERATRYITEALQPFVDNKICTSFTIDLARTGISTITGTITMFRGPKTAVALAYQDVWSAYGG